MKKLIALAVAAAAMPAMADISLSGSTRVEYVDNDTTTEISRSDLDLNITATSEMDNGVAVKTSFQADDSDASANITLTGAFGSLAIGDADMGGALDSVDGAAVGTARDDLSAGTGADADVKYTLPTIVEGLTLMASWASDDTTLATGGHTSVAAKYTTGGLTVFVGQDNYDTAGTDSDDATGYGVSYSMNGMTIGYGASDDEDGVETTAVALGYTMGNLALAYNSQEAEDSSGATTADQSTISAEYNMGGGVKAYVSSNSNDQTDTDTARVGLKFAF